MGAAMHPGLKSCPLESSSASAGPGPPSYKVTERVWANVYTERERERERELWVRHPLERVGGGEMRTAIQKPFCSHSEPTHTHTHMRRSMNA